MKILRRRLFAYAASTAALPLAACHAKTNWHESDISGDLPLLSFNMTDAPVTAAAFRGKVTLLYFGYTLCPDFCPTTLTNLAAVLHNLGIQANQVRILFVTVDPNRDSLATLKTYVSLPKNWSSSRRMYSRSELVNAASPGFSDTVMACL
jgi:protein SCO1